MAEALRAAPQEASNLAVRASKIRVELGLEQGQTLKQVAEAAIRALELPADTLELPLVEQLDLCSKTLAGGDVYQPAYQGAVATGEPCISITVPPGARPGQDLVATAALVPGLSLPVPYVVPRWAKSGDRLLVALPPGTEIKVPDPAPPPARRGGGPGLDWDALKNDCNMAKVFYECENRRLPGWYGALRTAILAEDVGAIERAAAMDGFSINTVMLGPKYYGIFWIICFFPGINIGCPLVGSLILHTLVFASGWRYSDTYLHFAARRGCRAEVLSTLLRLGADPRQKNFGFTTPMHICPMGSVVGLHVARPDGTRGQIISSVARGWRGGLMALTAPIRWLLLLPLYFVAYVGFMVVGTHLPVACMPLSFVLIAVLEPLIVTLRGRYAVVRRDDGRITTEWLGHGSRWAWHYPRAAPVQTRVMQVVDKV